MKPQITLERTQAKLDLVKAMASHNTDEARQAQWALAKYVQPILNQIVATAPTLSNFWTAQSYNEDDSPSIPLDLYTDTDEGFMTVWSASKPGSLASQLFTPSSEEIKVQTYRLDTAWSFDRKHAARSRLDVVGKTLARMAQEILLKREKVSATILLDALSKASTNSKSHVFRSNTAGELKIADFNRLITYLKRLNTSWTGGTPEARAGKGITDLLVSPEIVEGLRGLAYNPVNTKGTKTDIPATDSMRDAIYSNGGIPTFYGINIMEFNELGIGQKWNTLFDTLAGSTTFAANYGGTGSAAVFDGATEELVIGLDLTKESLIRVEAVTNNEINGVDYPAVFSIFPDDQFVTRQQKVGFYGGLEEGRVILDNRAIVGLIV